MDEKQSPELEILSAMYQMKLEFDDICSRNKSLTDSNNILKLSLKDTCNAVTEEREAAIRERNVLLQKVNSVGEETIILRKEKEISDYENDQLQSIRDKCTGSTNITLMDEKQSPELEILSAMYQMKLEFDDICSRNKSLTDSNNILKLSLKDTCNAVTEEREAAIRERNVLLQKVNSVGEETIILRKEKEISDYENDQLQSIRGQYEASI